MAPRARGSIKLADPGDQAAFHCVWLIVEFLDSIESARTGLFPRTASAILPPHERTDEVVALVSSQDRGLPSLHGRFFQAIPLSRLDTLTKPLKGVFYDVLFKIEGKGQSAIISCIVTVDSCSWCAERSSRSRVQLNARTYIQ